MASAPGGEVAVAEEEQVLREPQLLLPQEEQVAAGRGHARRKRHGGDAIALGH
jgi:hypothetical protein